jgi:predicted dehydrogenase
MAHKLTRRHFFYGTLLSGAIPTVGFGSTPSLKFMGYKSPNEKLNIASIGAGGKAASDIQGCSSENIVALTDPDDKRAERMFKLHQMAPKYKDFRRMFDKEGKNIDAVIIAIPDFMHATAAMWAMERGKHVYVQKPLTRTIWEARTLTAAAQKYKVASQMGNQGYSNEGTRQCAEMIWAGEIGNVTEVHAWTNRPIWPQGLTELPKEGPVPDTLDWDTWLGISAMRPYSPEYLPINWRGYFDWGCGALGDMACHILGAPNMALMLGAPLSVECIHQEGASSFTYPKKSVIRFDFPARGTMPPVKIFWYDGLEGTPPRPPGLDESELLGDPPPKAGTNVAPSSVSNGSLFVGEKGFITTGTYGQYTRLLPAEKMKDYKFPSPLLTRSPGHYRDWIRAAKGGDPACSNFNVSGPFTEWILLGVLALRFEGKLEWDTSKMRVTNNPEVNQYMKPKVRKGWQIG